MRASVLVRKFVPISPRALRPRCRRVAGERPGWSLRRRAWRRIRAKRTGEMGTAFRSPRGPPDVSRNLWNRTLGEDPEAGVYLMAFYSSDDVVDIGDPEDPSDNPSSYTGASVDRGGDPSAPSLLVTAPMANTSGFDTSGVEVKFNYMLELGSVGDLRTKVEWNEVLEYNDSDIIGYARVNKIGRASLPERRINLALNWSLDDHAVNFNVNHIAETAMETETDETGTIFTAVGKLDAYTIMNVSYIYSSPWNLEFSVGINNIADEDPVLDDDLSYDDALYSRVGRVYFAGIKYKF